MMANVGDVYELAYGADVMMHSVDDVYLSVNSVCLWW